MKGSKSESRGNDQYHFMDDGHRAESSSDMLDVSELGVRELLLVVPRDAWVLSTWRLYPLPSLLLSRVISPRGCQNSQPKINRFPKKVPVSQTAAPRHARARWLPTPAEQPQASLHCAQRQTSCCSSPAQPHTALNSPQISCCLLETPKGHPFPLQRDPKAVYWYLLTQNSLLKFVFSKYSNFLAQMFLTLPGPLKLLSFFASQKNHCHIQKNNPCLHGEITGHNARSAKQLFCAQSSHGKQQPPDGLSHRSRPHTPLGRLTDRQRSPTAAAERGTTQVVPGAPAGG